MTAGASRPFDGPYVAQLVSDTPEPPLGVRNVLGRFGDGWTHRITYGTGLAPVQTYGPPRGDGTRPKISVEVPAQSWGLRARHDDGRRVIALWTRPEGRAWSLYGAWRGRHDDENTPRQLNADALTEYIREGRP